jgi:hypothetical protein
MLDLVIVDGHAKGVIVRNLNNGESPATTADAVVLATGGYGNVFNLSTYARQSNATAIWRAYKRGACFANPCYTQIHPTCIPVSGDYQSKLTLMSESLRNDGRIWVPKKKEDREEESRRHPEEDRDYYLERMYPSFGNLAPATSPPAPPSAGVRRRPRRRRDRPRRLPRLRRRHQAPRRKPSPIPPSARALRQPLRHLQGDHRRERLPDADAHLPRRPLHHGRSLGGL